MTKTNGEYDLTVLKDGKWQAAGVLKCDQYFREQKVDLSRYLPKSGEIRVRLVQKDGNAAHIDSVFLGGMPPSEVKGVHERSAVKQDIQKRF